MQLVVVHLLASIDVPTLRLSNKSMNTKQIPTDRSDKPGLLIRLVMNRLIINFDHEPVLIIILILQLQHNWRNRLGAMEEKNELY